MTAPGTASGWVLGQVAGPRRPARVLHAGPSAIHLDVAGSCVAVLAEGTLALPCGIRTALPALPPVPPGSVAEVGDATVWLPSLEVRVARGARQVVSFLPPDAPATAQATVSAVAGRLAPVRDLLPAQALAALAAGDPAAAPALLGRGPGLTPLGDDVLAGWLVAAVAVRHSRLDDLRRAVSAAARTRTTTLSATLLACAARGEAVPPLLDLLRGVAGGDERLTARSLEALLKVGDTSGRGLALGTLLALSRPAVRAA